MCCTVLRDFGVSFLRIGTAVSCVFFYALQYPEYLRLRTAISDYLRLRTTVSWLFTFTHRSIHSSCRNNSRSHSRCCNTNPLEKNTHTHESLTMCGQHAIGWHCGTCAFMCTLMYRHAGFLLIENVVIGCQKYLKVVPHLPDFGSHL